MKEELDVLLADDDTDDCYFFKEALAELKLSINLTAVHNGEELMKLLKSEITMSDYMPLPDVLFLDLNMPRKNGFECLQEIKSSGYMKQLPVIILSTSFEQAVVNLLYTSGAQHFIRKPSDFSLFKKTIQQTFITTIVPQKTLQPARDQFVITLQNS